MKEISKYVFELLFLYLNTNIVFINILCWIIFLFFNILFYLNVIYFFLIVILVLISVSFNLLFFI